MVLDVAVVSSIFSMAGNAKSIGQMLGIIESVDSKLNGLDLKINKLNSKIDELKESELGAALRSLEQAQNTSVDVQRPILLQEARQFFNKALCLEKNERLFVALLGLAFCHFALGDKSNGLHALKEAEESLPRLVTRAVAQMYGITEGTIKLWRVLGGSHWAYKKLEDEISLKSDICELRQRLSSDIY